MDVRDASAPNRLTRLSMPGKLDSSMKPLLPSSSLRGFKTGEEGFWGSSRSSSSW